MVLNHAFSYKFLFLAFCLLFPGVLVQSALCIEGVSPLLAFV